MAPSTSAHAPAAHTLATDAAAALSQVGRWHIQPRFLFDEKCTKNVSLFCAREECAPLPALKDSGQRFNDATDGIIAAARLPKIAAWSLAAPHWDEHVGCSMQRAARTTPHLADERVAGHAGLARVLDCAHFNPAVSPLIPAVSHNPVLWLVRPP